jgi:tetratricopeptide (TPR) repeat protein
MRRLAALGLLAIGATAAAADPAAHARADKLFQDGRKYLESGEYKLACAAFEQSQAAEPAIGTQLNIALCYEKSGKLAGAYQAYMAAERAARAAKDKRANVAQKRVAVLEARVSRLRVVLPDDADPLAIYVLDSVETPVDKLTDQLVLDPGVHVIEIRIAGAKPRVQQITLAAGTRHEIQLAVPSKRATDAAPAAKAAPPPAPPAPPATPVRAAEPVTQRSKPRLFGGIALGAGGGAAIGVASAVALAARGDYKRAAADCPGGTCSSVEAFEATRDARARARAMTWVFGGGVALAAVGTYLIVTSKRTVPSERRVTIAPLVAPGAAGVAIGGAL